MNIKPAFNIGDFVVINNGNDLGRVVAIRSVFDVDTDDFSHYSYSVALGDGRRRFSCFGDNIKLFSL